MRESRVTEMPAPVVTLGGRGRGSSGRGRRRYGPATRAGQLALVLALGGPALPAAAQNAPVLFDVRLGALYSSPFAEGQTLHPDDAGTDGREPVDIHPGIGPAADAAILLGFSPRVDGELRLGLSWNDLTGSGASGTWDGGGVTTVSVLAGLGAELWPGVTLRGGLGKLFHSSGAAVLEGGSNTGLLFSGGVGYRPSLDLSFGLRLDADVQYYEFGSPALRESGAADASVYRISLMLAAMFGGDS
jgi:hypothetical protein